MKKLKLIAFTFGVVGILSLQGCGADAVTGSAGSTGPDVGICAIGFGGPCNGS